MQSLVAEAEGGFVELSEILSSAPMRVRKIHVITHKRHFKPQMQQMLKCGYAGTHAAQRGGSGAVPCLVASTVCTLAWTRMKSCTLIYIEPPRDDCIPKPSIGAVSRSSSQARTQDICFDKTQLLLPTGSYDSHDSYLQPLTQIAARIVRRGALCGPNTRAGQGCAPFVSVSLSPCLCAPGVQLCLCVRLCLCL